MKFIELLKKRRSQYSITNTISVPEEEVIEVIKQGIRHTPSPYNMQATRGIILLGENHKTLWNIVKEVLLERIGEERFVKTEEKIDKSFTSGYGTVLFFIDEDIVNENVEKFSDTFISWSKQSAGMAQINVWLGLTNLGVGANLQHYNPIIDDKVRDAFDVPENWKLISQMPFGDVIEDPKVKEFRDIDEIVRIIR